MIVLNCVFHHQKHRSNLHAAIQKNKTLSSKMHTLISTSSQWYAPWNGTVLRNGKWNYTNTLLENTSSCYQQTTRTHTSADNHFGDMWRWLVYARTNHFKSLSFQMVLKMSKTKVRGGDSRLLYFDMLAKCTMSRFTASVMQALVLYSCSPANIYMYVDQSDASHGIRESRDKE